MLPDESGVKFIANQNCFPGRSGLKPRYVILHGTAGGSNAENIANYFATTQGGANPVSSHYVIGQDGEIVQCVSEADGAWANGVLSSGHDSWWSPNVNPNNISVSIEHCKQSNDNSEGLTSAQQTASFRLVQHICQRWNIPMSTADANGGITGHFSIDPINRSHCPGTFPWDQLWAFLKGGNTPSVQGGSVAPQGGGQVVNLSDPIVSRYFTDGGKGTWKCVNGVIMLGANLAFYQNNGGPALLGLPLSNEIYLPQYPNTAIVPCERVIIVYDPDRKIDSPPIPGPCYLMHIDSGIGQQLLQSKTATASTTLQSLTNKLNQIHTLSALP